MRQPKNELILESLESRRRNSELLNQQKQFQYAKAIETVRGHQGLIYEPSALARCAKQRPPPPACTGALHPAAWVTPLTLRRRAAASRRVGRGITQQIFKEVCDVLRGAAPAQQPAPSEARTRRAAAAAPPRQHAYVPAHRSGGYAVLLALLQVGGWRPTADGRRALAAGGLPRCSAGRPSCALLCVGAGLAGGPPALSNGLPSWPSLPLAH
jgi:hypothetical protein